MIETNALTRLITIDKIYSFSKEDFWASIEESIGQLGQPCTHELLYLPRRRSLIFDLRGLLTVVQTCDSRRVINLDCRWGEGGFFYLSPQFRYCIECETRGAANF